MLFRELNQGKCKTYLLACEKTRKALLIDPIREKTDRYLEDLTRHAKRAVYRAKDAVENTRRARI